MQIVALNQDMWVDRTPGNSGCENRIVAFYCGPDDIDLKQHLKSSNKTYGYRPVEILEELGFERISGWEINCMRMSNPGDIIIDWAKEVSVNYPIGCDSPPEGAHP